MRKLFTAIFLVALVTLLVLLAMHSPVRAHHNGIALFYDDEMESAIPNQWYNAGIFPSIFTHDTTMKFSGNASLRLNFPTNCMTPAGPGQCGGKVWRDFPPSDEVYRRFMFRMGVAGQSNGSFTVYGAFTKMVKMESTHSPTDDNYARGWMTMGCCGNKRLNFGAERVPNPGATTNYQSGLFLVDNRWYCIEEHIKLNTPGQANGIYQAWVDNVLIFNVSNILFRNTGTDANAKLKDFEIVRQGGSGNNATVTGHNWYDRMAAAPGNHGRIGCPGQSVPQDTTNPNPPTNLTAQ